MATRVIMPQLGESVVEGTVARWLKKEGEPIAEFEALLEVNTDKVDTEVPSPASGQVLRVYVPEGETVRAGTLLAMIGRPGEAVPEAPEPGMAAASVEPAAAMAPRAPERKDGDLGFISPVVAKIAAEHNVDLGRVRGTGRGGRITKKDVLAFLEGGRAEAPQPPVAPWETPALGELFRPTEEVFGPMATAAAAPAASEATSPLGQHPGPTGALRGAERSGGFGSAPTPAGDTVMPLDNVRRSVAEHMVRSKHTSPHVTTVMEADLSRVVAHRQAQREAFARDRIDLTFTPYFVSAAVAGLKAFPLVNSSWGEGGIVLHRAVNVGVAVSLGEKGLIVPVIKNADRKSLLQLAAEVNDLAARARDRQLKPDEVQGGTFTITNHGVSGSLFATPIINQPQCGILGVGTIQKRAVVVNDAIAIRPMVYLSLTFDHRILDGASADGFLAKVVETLQAWS
jgi:2-oxoglutarate dehydrogenase E2 component (dihydrolipoamide succinyltransferase)